MLILLIGSVSFALDKKESTPGLTNPPQGIKEEQKKTSSPANPTPANQPDQGMIIIAPNALTPPPFKMQDEKRDEG